MLLQAVGSADDPSSGGRQMPSHWGSAERNIVTQSSPTGSQCIPAVGCAEAGRYLVRLPEMPDGCQAHGDELTYVSLGEGAVSEGEFWESLNTACTLHLPVLYVVADNGYAISVPAADQHPAPVIELVRGFRGLERARVDGTDYFAVRRTVRSMVERVRAGVGPGAAARRRDPALLPLGGRHPGVVPLAPRSWRSRPRTTRSTGSRSALVERGVLTAGGGRGHPGRRGRGGGQGQRRGAGRGPPGSGPRHRAGDGAPGRSTSSAETTAPTAPATDGAGVGEPVAMGEAIRRTLHEQMAADVRIRVFGEDVADAREALLAELEGKGGVFGTTHGLQRDFGQARCFNTPLSEANIIGRAVGHGLRGLRPCPEIQFFDYIWPAMTQIKSEAATIRWRSNGSFTCPMVVRVPIGGYLTGGSIWHSQSGESIFAHVPGLLIAFPSRASDAAGLLRYAFRCEDPVLFLEHKHLLRQPYTVEPFPGPEPRHPVRSGLRASAGRRPHHRHVGRDGREVAAGRRPRWPRPRASRSRSSTCARSLPGTTTSSPSRWPPPIACWSCTRTC